MKKKSFRQPSGNKIVAIVSADGNSLYVEDMDCQLSRDYNNIGTAEVKATLAKWKSGALYF